MSFSSFALALLALAAQPAQAQPAPPAGGTQAYPTAAQIAQNLQSRLPMDLGNDIRATAITAEGQVLVWTIDIPAEVMAGHDVSEATEPLRTGFCGGPGAVMFQHGVALRVDVQVAGAAPVRGEVITSCPDS